MFFAVPLRAHLWIALLLGLIVRVCSAYFVYGPQALDDYKHGVWPAYQFFAGQEVTLPDYRSHILVWFLSVFVRLAYVFDLTSALHQVRAMYLGLGITSLVGIYGTYLYVNRFGSRVFGAAALYLVALFPLMPFISTRAFGEALAMSLVALAFGVLESSRVSKSRGSTGWMFGFIVLGVATLFRFHVGLLYVTYMGVLIWKKRWRGVWASLVAGLVVLILAAVVDALSGKGPLDTLIIYLGANEGGAAKYGVSPWYNPLLFVLGVALAPFCFLMWRETKYLWRRHQCVLIPFLVFLGAHMLVPHKEERFLYPILILEMWTIAYLWSAASFRKWVRRIYSPVLIGLSVLVLPVVCFVNTQEGEIEPPALIENQYRKVLFLDYESLFGKSRFQFYFLRQPSVLEKIELNDFTAHKVDQGLSDYKELKAVAFLTSSEEGYDRMRMIEGISTIEAECRSIQKSGSIMDRLIFTLNPKHNQRRRPTWYLVCERRGT
jgi:hypothetical protein